MFKKTTILVLALTLALTACSSAQGSTTQNSTQSGQPGMPGTGKLSAMSELVIGTLKLDGTANAVTSAQAAELIPLWQVYKQLMTSDTAAQEEIDGLGQQIKAAMTVEQTSAISKMDLTQADMLTYMQQAGPAGSGSQGSGTSTSRNNSSGGMPGGPGGMPGGAPPMGGMPGGDFGGPQARPSGTQTANATPRAPGAGMNRVPSVLIDTLIQYLKKVSAS